MRALVKTEPNPGMELQERPKPSVGLDDVLVQTKAVGIDGGFESKIYQWVDSSILVQNIKSKLPCVLGHEFSGEIVKTGDNITNMSVGQKVAVDPSVFCNSCKHCLSGNMNICPHRRGIGTGDLDGGLAEYVVVPGINVYPFTNLTYDEGAYLEVLAIGVHALERSNFTVGDSVAITGPGPVGMGILISALAAGARAVYILGVTVDEETRLPVAKELGASAAINVDNEELLDSVDVFFEASGFESALEHAVTNTEVGGEIVQVGIYHGSNNVSMKLNNLTRQGISLKTSAGRSDSSWRRAIDIAKEIDLSPMIGPAFNLDEYKSAFEAERNREGVKIILNM